MTVGMVKTSATRKPVAHVALHVVHRHAGVAAVGVRFVGRRGEGALFHQQVADVVGHRAPGAVIAAVLDPLAQLGDRGGRRIECHRRGLGRRVALDVEDAGGRRSTASTTAFSEPRYMPPTWRTAVAVCWSAVVTASSSGRDVVAGVGDGRPHGAVVESLTADRHALAVEIHLDPGDARD